MDIGVVWTRLETKIHEMGDNRTDWPAQVENAKQLISNLLEYPVEDILKQVDNSSTPSRGVLKWVVREAREIGGIDAKKLDLISQYTRNK